MCGITGFISSQVPNPIKIMNNMIGTLLHRGPDNTAVWNDLNGVNMAHSRLSIIDLSEFGNQPIFSKSGRYVMVFNGEIYNHKDLTKYLDHKYKDCGDTKIIMEIITKYGINFCLNVIEGMFSIILLDKNQHSIYLIRDRFGTKPLYIFKNNNQISLSSNIVSIQSCCDDKQIGKLTKLGETFFLLFGFIYISNELIKDINEAPPGRLLKIDIDTFNITNIEIDINNDFYNQKNNWDKQVLDSYSSDVPLSLLLSGGVDSTYLAFLARKYKVKNLETFTLRNDSGSNLEDVLNAKKISSILRFKNTTINLNKTEIENIIDSYIRSMELPTDDGLNIYYATRKIFQNKIKVCLTGLGGDEFFGGYSSSDNSLIKLFLRNCFLWKYFPFVRNFILKKGYGGYSKKNIVNPSSIDGYLYGKAFIFKNMPTKIVEKAINKFSDFLKLRLPDGFEKYTKKNKISLLELHGYCIPQLVKDSDTFGMANSVEVRPSLLVNSLFNKLIQNKIFTLNKKGLKNKIDKDVSIFLNKKKNGFTVDIKDYIRNNLEKINSQIFKYEDNLKYKYVFDDLRVSIRNNKKLNLRIVYFIWRLYILSYWKSMAN